MLHIVNKSFATNSALQSCLKHLLPSDIILLYEDGVLNLIKGSPGGELLAKVLTMNSVYALLPDIAARGITDRVLPGINIIDYPDFVDLVIKYKKVQSWL